MSKAFTHLALALCTASLCAHAAAAQTPGWVVVAPEGEGFKVLMPRWPAPAEATRVSAGGLNAAGWRYAAAANAKTSFVVWSLRAPETAVALLARRDSPGDDVGDALFWMDRLAGLAWELLVTPEVGSLRGEDEGARAARAERRGLGMTHVRDFALDGRPAREYQVRLKDGRGGPVYVFADGLRIYVAAGLGVAHDPRLKLFADSFTLEGARHLPAVDDPSLPAPLTIQADPLLVKPDPRDTPYGSHEPGGSKAGGGPGGGAVDDTRPFTRSVVTREAVIIYRPEPGYTEAARKNKVSGVVRLRAILSAEGTVKDVVVVKGLPYGLTEKAVAVARQIRFQPAEKDGRVVSQYADLEYNFDIY